MKSNLPASFNIHVIGLRGQYSHSRPDILPHYKNSKWKELIEKESEACDESDVRHTHHTADYLRIINIVVCPLMCGDSD